MLKLCYYSLFHSWISYSAIIWGNSSQRLISKLQVLQNSKIKIIFKLSRRFSTKQLFKKAGIMPFETLVRTRSAIHMYLISRNLILCNTDLSGIASDRILERNANLHPIRSYSTYYGLKSAINTAVRNYRLKNKLQSIFFFKFTLQAKYQVVCVNLSSAVMSISSLSTHLFFIIFSFYFYILYFLWSLLWTSPYYVLTSACFYRFVCLTFLFLNNPYHRALLSGVNFRIKKWKKKTSRTSRNERSTAGPAARDGRLRLHR